ncbi:MAG TPA: vanadium-dependent haloperoxidase [Longimicrobium sp.]|jgi:hypothetical protein|uniref:vanadium-dependent haloperoxidase n=1 Tax=Longimicrobium sp. TaxID=2029185 RepID=UPI002ED821D2
MANAQYLVDDFSDNFPNPDVWAPYGGGERETNRRLEIALRSGIANDGGYTSVTGYDLTGSWVHVELVQALRASPALEVYLTLTRDSTHAVSLLIAGGMLFSSQLVAGILSDVAMAAYDPERHRWLRLREQSGTLFYESSADAARWEVLAAVPVPFDLTVVKVSIGATTTDPVPSPGTAIFDNVNAPDTGVRRQVEERRLAARSVRVQAAELAAERRHQEHANNNDEVNHPTRLLAGLYSKSLKHDALGDPDPGSYATLLRALQSRDPGDFEEIILASATAVKLTNPQSGLTFDIAGPDPQERTLPPAPRFDSEVTAHEMGELYWMALARDVYFGSYGTDPVVAAAISSLNGEFPRFGGTVPATAQNVFRGIYPGEQVGPYVSQFLLKGNIDQRKPNGLGLDAVEGFISYGARVIDQRLIPAATGVNHLTSFAAWLDVQNGVDRRGLDQFDTTSRRFIRNLRDGATLVHFDQVIDSFYNAAFLLLSEPAGNQHSFQSGLTGRPQVDPEFARNPGNPYYSLPGVSRTQAGFATFGPAHLLQVLSEALGRALRAVWWQKWGVHRRLRPEEYGGRVHNQVLFTNTGGSAGRSYPLHSSITASLRTGALAPYVGQAGESFPDSYLLPQAYPEGAPTHPAYGAGHATGSGACVTILKAFFDENAPIQNPVLSNSTGFSLVSYTGADAAQMTVGGELNKLAGNIALFRNAAGVHWRSDYTESLPFGEAIAIGLLQEMSLGFNEDDAFFELTRFDGQKIRIFDGRVVPVA